MTQAFAFDDPAACNLHETPDGLDAINVCSECEMPLGLAAPTVIRPANAWLCGGCGSAYFARPADASKAGSLKGVRPVHYDQVFQAADFRPTSSWRRAPFKDLRRVLQFLSSFEHRGNERRRERRHAVALPVLALPLGDNFRVIGAAVEMTMINISRAGGALLDPEPCQAPYLAVDFSVSGLETVQAILEVLRVRPLVTAHEIAGRWLCRLLPWVRKTPTR